MAQPHGTAAPWYLLTLETRGDGEIHGPADQGHDQSQQNEENPVLAHLGDEEPLALQGAHCGHKGGFRAGCSRDEHSEVAEPGWQHNKLSQGAAVTR